MSTSRLGLVGRVTLALLAVVAVSGLFVAVAQAAGPQWTVKEGGVQKLLGAAEERSLSTVNNLSKFKLKTATATVVCNRVKLGSAGGTIMGGNPGTDKAEIVFTECTLEGKPNCKAEEVVGGVGNEKIVTKVYTMLAYEKPKSASMALDAFFPENSSEVFAKFSLVGEECGALNGAEIVVKPKGTSVALPNLSATRQCGVLAEVGKTVSSKFVLTINGELSAKGALNFPAARIKEGEYWNGTEFKELKCELSAGVLGAATEIGESELDLAASVESYGWE